ncbi:MAG: hypothetical protein N2652_09245 [Kiritimatiellae bacterium]|nr:hypothetical protein [Kiritimatiellia bacterium]
MSRTLVGFGFGPIQAGLFVPTARAEGFDRITIAEIDRVLVRALRESGGTYVVNVAYCDGLETLTITGVEVLDPSDGADAAVLDARLRAATTVVTALPSPSVYGAGGPRSVAARIAAALCAEGPPVVVYAAENHPDAPQQLAAEVERYVPGGAFARPTAFVGTVIGKMSQTLSGEALRTRTALVPVTPDLDRAFLVESFHRIVAGPVPAVCGRGRILAFREEEELRPFQELKLYGHNAAHLLLGLVARALGRRRMPELSGCGAAIAAAQALIDRESGAALRRRWPSVGGELASSDTLQQYAADLVHRMICPWLDDAVGRVLRDLPRKLARDDRIFGALAVCDQHDVPAPNLEAAALGGLAVWRAEATGGGVSAPLTVEGVEAALRELWGGGVEAAELRSWAVRLLAAQSRWQSWLAQGGD